MWLLVSCYISFEGFPVSSSSLFLYKNANVRGLRDSLGRALEFWSLWFHSLSTCRCSYHYCCCCWAWTQWPHRDSAIPAQPVDQRAEGHGPSEAGDCIYWSVHPSVYLLTRSSLLPAPPYSRGSGLLETALVYHVYFLITETESKNLANRHQARNKGNRSQAQCLSACALGRISNSLARDALQGSL